MASVPKPSITLTGLVAVASMLCSSGQMMTLTGPADDALRGLRIEFAMICFVRKLRRLRLRRKKKQLQLFRQRTYTPEAPKGQFGLLVPNIVRKTKP
jgi:hypothetical protein